MAIFKKVSPLEGNPTRTNGVMIEFTGLYYETENEEDIEFLKGFKCYQEVESREVAEVIKPQAPKTSTGVVSAANLAKLAATNK